MGRDLSDPLTSRRTPLVGCSRPTPGARGLGQERFLCFCRTPFWGGHFPVSSHVPVPSPCPQFIQQTCFHHQTDARLAPSPGNTVTRWWPHLKGDGLAQRVGCLSRGSPRSRCSGQRLLRGRERGLSQMGASERSHLSSAEDVCGCQWETGQVESEVFRNHSYPLQELC